MGKIYWSTLVLVLACSLMGCGKKNTATAETTKEETTQAECPDFNADSAFQFTADQCAFGPRVPNTEAHKACGSYIADKFAAYGAEITDQRADLKACDGTMLKSRNIIASLNPDAEKRVLICAHWDSRPWADNDPDSANWRKPVLAANDGASGVAVMLEMARLLQQQPVKNIGVDFICFDAEDYGTPQWSTTEDDPKTWCLGSQYWSQNPHKEGYKAMYGILLDMVGGQGSTFSQEAYSQEYATGVLNNVWNTAEALGYGNYFPKRTSGYIIDDHVPVNQTAGIPCIDIVPYFTDGPSSFGPTWHTIKDDMNSIDKNVLKAVGQTVLQVVYNENKNNENH